MTRIGSLFSGYSGLDMAVQSVLGGEVAWVSDIEPASCQVLAAHHPGVPNLDDITVIDWATVPPVDVLTGGYPCQPFSHAGQRKGKNDERHLWPYVCAAIDALRPGLVVLENVRGHLTLGFGDVLADLSRVGYDARWGVVRASDAGAPHGRARIFITAHPSRRTGGAWTGWGVPEPEGAAGLAARDSEPSPNPDGDGHGRELHARGMGDLEGEAAGGAPERQRSRRVPDAGGDLPAADTDSPGQRIDTRVAPRTQAGAHAGDGSDGAGGTRTDWGKYAPAIARWERVLGRPAPSPTIPGANGRPRLAPAFVEWMMGLPAGHVTGHGLRPAQELKMLGNGVVPQQAALALRMLGVA